MKSKIRITVYELGGEYFATMTIESNVPNFNPPNSTIIFFLLEEIDPTELQAFRDRAKEEAQRRGIAKVINLY